MKPTRQEAIDLLNTQEVYDALNLQHYHIHTETRYISLNEVLSAIGVTETELEE